MSHDTKGNPRRWWSGTPARGAGSELSGSKPKHKTGQLAAQPAANALPSISLKQHEAGSDVWDVTVDGVGTIKNLRTAKLIRFAKFNQECVRNLGRCFAPVDAARWSKLVDDAMREGGVS